MGRREKANKSEPQMVVLHMRQRVALSLGVGAGGGGVWRGDVVDVAA